jgi:hypothetical protein
MERFIEFIVLKFCHPKKSPLHQQRSHGGHCGCCRLGTGRLLVTAQLRWRQLPNGLHGSAKRQLAHHQLLVGAKWPVWLQGIIDGMLLLLASAIVHQRVQLLEAEGLLAIRCWAEQRRWEAGREVWAGQVQTAKGETHHLGGGGGGRAEEAAVFRGQHLGLKMGNGR